MSFKCALCELDIQVGEPMLSDERMNLAHESCVRRKQNDPGSSVVVVSSPSPPSTLTLTSPDACVPSARPPVCVECDGPAISMCPVCLRRVHQNYGYDGKKPCSLIHEAKCPGAREARDPKLKLNWIVNVGTAVIAIEPGTIHGNGKHVAPKKAKKKRGRR
jgi:hypothetical protein